MDAVEVRELRRNFSRYLSQVKEGESFVVTERGREIAILTPSGPVARPPAGPPFSEEILDELREERL